MKDQLKKAIENENEQELKKYLEYNQSHKIDSGYYDLIEKVLRAEWHSQHEDLVGTIYLKGLADDRFVDPILQIALKKERFRWYDDELEATLRKCVHALKTINSVKSNQAIEQLKKLNNDNVQIALKIYE